MGECVMITYQIEAGIQKYVINPFGCSAHICGCSIAGIAGSSPAEGMDIHLFRFFVCCVGGISSFRSVLPCAGVHACVNVCVCLIVCDVKT